MEPEPDAEPAPAPASERPVRAAGQKAGWAIEYHDAVGRRPASGSLGVEAGRGGVVQHKRAAAAAAAALEVGNTSPNAPAGSSPSPATSPTASDPASPPSAAQEPMAQEASNSAPAEPAEPGGLMSLDRIGGLFAGSE